jgi:hypothetical protein
MTGPLELGIAGSLYRSYRQGSISWRARQRFSIVAGEYPVAEKIEGTGVDWIRESVNGESRSLDER